MASRLTDTWHSLRPFPVVFISFRFEPVSHWQLGIAKRTWGSQESLKNHDLKNHDSKVFTFEIEGWIGILKESLKNLEESSVCISFRNSVLLPYLCQGVGEDLELPDGVVPVGEDGWLNRWWSRGLCHKVVQCIARREQEI